MSIAIHAPALKYLSFAALLGSTVPLSADPSQALDLAGPWRVALDRANLGRDEQWFARTVGVPLQLPGSVQQYGLGDPVTTATSWTGGIFDKSYFTAETYAEYREAGNVKVPFWLQPATHYTGVAWYQREFDVPADWLGRRVTLLLERPHWKTTVWLDDHEIGSADSLSVPHRYELSPAITSGPHRLTIRVDNTVSPDIGENSHSVSDHTQGNWNGIAGRIGLFATASAWIDDLQIFPDLTHQTLTVRGRVGRIQSADLPSTVALQPTSSASVTAAVSPDGGFAATLPISADAARWDEFNPRLHHLTARLENGETLTIAYGLREFFARGRQLEINARPVFLRGTLDCAAYPRTGHPPTDLATWLQILATVKAHGLNHVRFHSWCPPAAAFVAADELGIYCQVEVASWPNWSTTLGDGKPVDAWIESETARILREYGNHPSFVLLCAGNEPGGDHFAPWLSRWVTQQRATDPRRLYTSAAGWPEIPENDLHVTYEPRIQQWGAGLHSRINALPPETATDYGDFIRTRSAPVVSHEIGQWCVYPNFAEMPKYTGYLQPRNFEIFRASLARHGLAAQAHDFLIASGKLQTLCYKEEIESALRTPQMGGFQLLGLSDFPGQGTALVGVLDAFWEEKGYVTPAEFRRFCNSTVPLVRLDRRVFTATDHLTATITVAHFGAAPLSAAQTHWKLQADDGTVAAQGTLPASDIPIGNGALLGRIDCSLAGVPAPARYRLIVSLTAQAAAGGATPVFENDWDIWVYPAAEHVPIAGPAGVTVSSALDDATQRQLAAGGTVMLVIPPARVAPDPQRGPIALGFSSIFWNTAWTNGQAPHTLGILCDPRQPALAAFPTDPWSNWQWWYPITHAAPLLLDALPSELKPTVQVIDDWFTNRKLALVFEARVGRGRLLVTSINLTDAVLDPVRRQLRASLLAYAASDQFQPSVAVTPEQIMTLFTH